MSTKKTKDGLEGDLPAELAPAAAELAASAQQQSEALAAAQADEQNTAARAYRLLQEDQAAGKPIAGWAEYLEKAQTLKS